MSKLETDPYHHLEYVFGSGDDFVCFDYDLQDGRIRLHAVLNSETGHFIEDFREPIEAPIVSDVAISAALWLVDEAFQWTFDNEVKHSKRGWNQDGYYFYRAVYLDVMRARGVEVPRFSQRQKRLGGKRIQAFCKF